ncbi:hypothetical protein GWN26_04495 [Candidatus Saccharibacteria bacterium]|nr:hypothetical protein [Candidatus Saccharibacteria bacterium]NIW80872.1 hypothetical protein [Calditrichia bacterium]
MTTPKGKPTGEGITDKARDIWLAGLGVFSTVEEEGEKLFNRFLERGRELESKGETFEKRTKDKVDSISAYVTERTSKISEEISARLKDSVPGIVEEKFKSALETFGVPSRSEMKELNDKVDKLTKSVAELSKKLEESGKTGTRA